jgi:hypothetical protein
MKLVFSLSWYLIIPLFKRIEEAEGNYLILLRKKFALSRIPWLGQSFRSSSERTSKKGLKLGLVKKI